MFRVFKKLGFVVPIVVVSLGALNGCSGQESERFAKTTDKDVFGDHTDKITYLEQNWNKKDSVWFYNTSQGSNWMPYTIFLHLEQAENDTLFRDDGNMNRYRYLIQTASTNNPDGLPVGFVKNSYKGKDYIGFTCAACHTTQLDYNKTGIRIDGGPALADMDSMLNEIEKALKATLDNDAKFERLAKNVLTDTTDKKAKANFRTKLEAAYADQKLYNHQNNPMNGSERIDYGFARLDAFGRIFNRTLSHLTPNDPNNFNSPNAPASYPFLWDTPHSDFVQWNGIGDNHGKGLGGYLGPIGRNTGEVIGVFGSVDVTKNKGKLHYEASANFDNLNNLERKLQALISPQWPEHILPPINKALAAQGHKIYQKYKCGWCHSGDLNVLTETPTFKRDDPKRILRTQFASLDWIGTDKQLVHNALQRQGKSGIYEGESDGSNGSFPEITPIIPALTVLTKGVILAPAQDDPKLIQKIEGLKLIFKEYLYHEVPTTHRHNDFQVVTAENNAAAYYSVYKARTLNGIWATAPYLHNGSVQNLYELLLPSCNDTEAKENTNNCRSNRFTLGGRDFDPVKVGFVSKKKADYPALFEFDTTKPGNSNRGHEYAAGVTSLIQLDAKGKPVFGEYGQKPKSRKLPAMNHEQRMALVEYLKTL